VEDPSNGLMDARRLMDTRRKAVVLHERSAKRLRVELIMIVDIMVSDDLRYDLE